VLEDNLKECYADIDLAYVAQNVSKSKRGKKIPQDSVANTLKELGDLQRTVIDKNSFDLALYQLVSERLDSQIRNVARFDEKLADFQARCQRLARRKIPGR
jgi:hypothetical protein